MLLFYSIWIGLIIFFLAVLVAYMVFDTRKMLEKKYGKK